MSEMIERVAIALFCSEFGGQGWPSEMPDSAKVHWRTAARAAIEAMREPTNGMLQDAGEEWHEAQLAWDTMINSALK